MNAPGRPSVSHRGGRAWHGFAVLLAVCGSAGASAQGWSLNGEASLASDYVERGISPWPREMATQGVLALSDGLHWSASLALTAPVEQARNYQAVARGGAYWSANENWQLHARAGVYGYPGGGYYRFFNRHEFGLGANYRDLWSIDLSASQLKEKEADDHLYPAIDLGLRWPLTEQWAFAAGIGRTEMHWWPDVWYTYADIGLVWQTTHWRAALRYLGASDAARLYMQRAAEPHTTLSLSWLF
jgi:hypothetical protein